MAKNEEQKLDEKFADEIIKEVDSHFKIPFPLGGFIKDGVRSACKVDINKDGKGDARQAAPYLKKATPHLIELFKEIDWNAVLIWALSKFAKNKTVADAKIAALQGVVKEAEQEVGKA